jgi:hypothetical protein
LVGLSRGLLAVVSLSFILQTPAIAQDRLPSQIKGTWDISAWIAGQTGEETRNNFQQAQVLTAGVFFGRTISGEISHWIFRNSMEYGVDIIPVFATLDNQHVVGGAFDPVVFRWNSALHTSWFEPYLEGTGGGVVTNANLPPGRTSSFNVTARGGGGLYLFTKRRQAIDVGFQWSHMSNANLGLWNPEFNGLQLRIGYHWYK